jgi:cell division protein ZapE
VLERYRRKVSQGEIEADPAQLEAAARLDQLARDLAQWRPGGRALFGLVKARRTPPPRGVYIHGAVGRGKTMLMDLFYEGVAFAPKRRSHFHAFMAEAHERIQAARKKVEGDPIPSVALEMAGDPGLLCFDELHVTDIADAMILGRFFKVVFERGVVIVATSNAAPADLYKNGLNRQLFLPFIDLIEDNLDVLELKSAKDFRLDKLAGHPLYFAPADAAARQEMDRHWSRLTGGTGGGPAALLVKGRTLAVPRAALGAARFSFADLCEANLGSVDYLEIAQTYHTVLIDDIPVLSPARRDVARRFINLIDTLYDNRITLIASAEAEPDDLYRKGDGADLFQRTASRLTEMRSEGYLQHRGERGLSSA